MQSDTRDAAAEHREAIGVAGDVTGRLNRLRKAFDKDGFDLAESGVFRFSNRLGIIAEHRTARNYDTGRRKRVYYVEGTPYEMGYLMGRMAEPEIDRMTSLYIDGMVRDLIRRQLDHEEDEDAEGENHQDNTDDNEGQRSLPRQLGLPRLDMHSVLVRSVYSLIENRDVTKAVPKAFREEIAGIVDGCRHAANLRRQRTKVNSRALWVLNAGIDVLYSLAYTGKFLSLLFHDAHRRVRPTSPFLCNAFALLNEATTGGALFGRDFMFPTGGVFQDLACLIIRNPTREQEGVALPTVSMAAPGIVGSMATMNVHGVAGGVDVSPGANSDHRRPGMNSLLLVRHSIENGKDATGAVECIVQAKRGVSWCYIIADGGHGEDRACVVEAGASDAGMPSKGFIEDLSKKDRKLRSLLPSAGFLKAHPTGKMLNGAMARWADTTLPLRPYIESFNEKLWAHLRPEVAFDDVAFGERGYINPRRTPKEIEEDGYRVVHEKRCPENFYFAPQRGKPGEVLLLTNHFLHPAMRLYAMHPWTNKLTAEKLPDDTQWRYDELNARILQALDRSPISYAQARNLIDYLSPLRKPPAGYYYAAEGPWSESYADKGQWSRDYAIGDTWKQNRKRIAVGGAVLLFDLKARTAEAKYGYHADDWVKISLKRYIE